MQAAYRATLVDYSDVLAPGERGLVLCIAPDIRSKPASCTATSLPPSSESPALKPLLESSTQTTLRLTNGIDIEVRSASFRRLRGVTAVAVIADELCFWFSDETSANRDSEILQAVRPTLLTTHGSLSLISTPYSRRGATWEAFNRDYGPQGDPSILVATGSSRTFNPSLSQRVIDRAYERDPVAAAAEYGGQWRNDISAFISPRGGDGLRRSWRARAAVPRGHQVLRSLRSLWRLERLDDPDDQPRRGRAGRGRFDQRGAAAVLARVSSPSSARRWPTTASSASLATVTAASGQPNSSASTA